jgi:polar amino acid transport system substrate-binding protein
VEWSDDPQRFLFTDSVIRIRDLVFSRRQTPLRYRSPDDLLGKSVGTHLGYVYPLLTAYFDSKRILRADAGTEKSMLLMLQAGRTDALVMNELVALWLIKTENLQDQFTSSETELDGYEYRLMFGPQWSDFVAQFNRELARMKRDGRLARVIGKYRLSTH